MNKRPLPVTITGWFFLIVSLLYVISRIASGVPTADSGEFAILNWQLETLIFAPMALFSFNILRGRNWARLGLCVALGLDLLRNVLLDWSDSWHSLHLDVLGDLLAFAALYGPGSRTFFSRHAKAPPLMHQSGTAICYVVTVIFLTATIALPSAYARLDGPEDYKYILVACVPLLTYGIGNAFGLVLNPRHDVGWMLIIAAVLNFGFGLSIYLRQAGSFEAALRGNVPVLTMNPWIAVIVATLVGMAGVVLVRQSAAEPSSGAPTSEGQTAGEDVH